MSYGKEVSNFAGLSSLKFIRVHKRTGVEFLQKYWIKCNLMVY